MTIAIGINVGLYVILAADTRTTYYLKNEPFHDDNSFKVHKTTIGLITGAGFCPLLDFVKSRLAIEQTENTDSILAIIKEAREEIRHIWRNFSQIDSSIEQTGWIFSYNTLLNDESIIRLGVYHENLSLDNCVIYGVGDPAIIYPLELSHSEVDNIHPTILNEIVIPNTQSEIQSSIQKNTVIVVSLIRALYPYCQSISNRFQIGIHMNRQTGISEIADIQDSGAYSLNISLDNN